jgi:hypothetical protein
LDEDGLRIWRGSGPEEVPGRVVLRGERRSKIGVSLPFRAGLVTKLNGVDPQAWLADVLARINDHNITDLAALLP